MIGVIILSFAWLFFAFGSVMNFQAWRAGLKARDGDHVPSGIPFLPGIAGMLAVFFTLPLLAGWGFMAPWPLLWIMLPLFADVYCLGSVLIAVHMWIRGNNHRR
jgi:hypothetical protein